MDFELYHINRQLDLFCAQADSIVPGACRDFSILRIERLNIEHHLRLVKLAAVGCLEQA